MTDKLQETETTAPAEEARPDADQDRRDAWAEFDAMDAAKDDDADPAAAEVAAEHQDAEQPEEAPPAEEASAEEASAEDDASEPAEADPQAAEQTIDDLLAELPAVARQEIERLRHLEKSRNGRVPHLQGRVNELTREIEALRAARQRPDEREPDGAARGAAADQATDLLASEDWKQFAEEYPEISTPLGKALGALIQETSSLKEGFAAISRDRREAALDAETSALVEEHPDWREVVTRDVAAFREWVEDQPRHIREAAHRNANGIQDAREAADVVGRYKAHLGINGNGSGRSDAKADHQPPALSTKRQQQLKSARTVQGSARRPIRQDIPQDREAAWDAFEAMGM